MLWAKLINEICILLAPSPPQNLRVTYYNTDSITIEWQPPAEPNGIIKNYIIKYSPNNISWDSLDKRDYCRDGM